MNELPARADPQSPSIGSAIHLEFIRAVIDSGSPSGAEEVEAFHRALFLHQNAKDLERFQQEKRLREDRLAGLEDRLQRTLNRLSTEEKLLPALEDGRPDTHPTAPWNLWDRAMFVLCTAAIACLLVFGIFNVSFNLLESGIITFSEHPLRAYFWAALLPVGALAVKVGWDVLRSGRKRDFYLWSCLGIGVAAVMVWVASYASIYPMLSKTAEDDIARLSVFDDPAGGTDYLSQLTSGGVKRIDMILVAAQAMAEICLSAALGIYLTQIYARHRPVRLARNPAFHQFDEERAILEAHIARERLAFAEARGSEARLENQLAVYLAYARSLFQRESSLRRDPSHQKRLLIEEIAERLRTGLEEVEARTAGRNGGNGDNGDRIEALTPAREGSR